MNLKKVKQRYWLIFFLLHVSLFFKIDLLADDWPQWRGQNRDGISKEVDLIKNWPDKGPQILWRIPITDGYSSISVINDRIYTMWIEDGFEYLFCLDVLNGNIIWKYRVGPIFKDSWGEGPRSSPTVHKDLVYVVGAKGHFHAVNVTNGSSIWSHDLVKEYGTKIPRWGYSCSPLIYRNLVIVDVGGKENHAFMAFDNKNGNAIWNSHTDTLAYSSPLVVSINNQTQIVFFNKSGLHALSPQNGDILWQYEWKGSINITNPIFIAPDKIFISCSYKMGATLLRINRREGSYNVEPIWKSKVMKNHFNSSVLVGNYLYGFDDAVLKCITAETGVQKWFKRRLGKGSLIYADGQLIVLSERGKLVLIEANPGQYVETASHQVLKGRCWTPPSLANGRLFLRNQKEIVCVDLNKQKLGRK